MADDRLVATDRRLNQRAFAVAGLGLPLHPAIGVDRRDMLVSLIGGVGVLAFQRIGARRNYHNSIGGMPGNGVVGRLTVIGSIGRELSDRHVDLVKERLHLRGIPCILVRQDVCNDVAAIGI